MKTSSEGLGLTMISQFFSLGRVASAEARVVEADASVLEAKVDDQGECGWGARGTHVDRLTGVKVEEGSGILKWDLRCRTM